MEMQFYPPGWAPFQLPGGISCGPTQWCAALNIDSLSENLNTGQALNPTCQGIVGVEYVNFAFITKSGAAHAPANPVDATLSTYTPNPSTDFFMNSGDSIRVTLHDTSAGFQVVLNDLTAGTSGSMTASTSNGFGEVKFAPSPSTACVNIPTAFHPMYSTSSPNTRVVWAAHSYNVAFSDEIGHFEYCNGVDPHTGVCHNGGVNDKNGGDPSVDDYFCLSQSQSTLVRVSGCVGSDTDFDGVSYQNTWPGTFTNVVLDSRYHPSPVQFSSLLAGGTTNYAQVAFETDLPRIELGPGISPTCDRNTGANCVNPPPGAQFYPLYTTNTASIPDLAPSACVWQLGGTNIPGTTNTFGGSSTTEFGHLFQSVYPGQSGPFTRYNNFQQVLSTNPCTSPLPGS
jgi:hypothetical protein